MSRTTALSIGAVIAVLWIAMAATALVSAFQGLRNDRLDWFVGWGLVGGLLLIAGIAAFAGTWVHQQKVRGGAL